MSALTRDEALHGAQAVLDISAAMLMAAGECLKVHGNDPAAPAIVAAAFVLTVERITTEIDPTFRKRVLMQLGEMS